jgi:hypothetical protein
MIIMMSDNENKYLIAALAKNKYFLFLVKIKQPTIKAKYIHNIKILNLIIIIGFFLNA